MAIDTQDHQQTPEEALRAENACLHAELEQLRRERQVTMATVSEDGYRFFLEAVSDGIFQWSLNAPLDTTLPVDEQVRRLNEGLILRGCNRAFAVQYGLTSSVISQGFRLYDVHAADNPTNNGMMRRYVLNGYRSDGEVTEKINSKGERRWFLNRIVSRVENGFVYDGWGMQTDITELRAAQEALFVEQENAARQQAAELQKANEVLRHRAAIAMEQERTAQERATELARVNMVLQNCLERLSASDGPEAFLGHVLTEIARAIEASSLFLFRYDPAENGLALFLSYLNGILRRGPCGDEFAIFAAPFPADVTPAFEIMRRERRFFTPVNSPVPAEEFAWPGVMEELSRRNPSDVAHLALLVGETPVGSLGFEFQDGKRLCEEDQPLVMALAQQAAIALRLSDLAVQERLTAVAHEREDAAQARAEQLAKSIQTLRQSVARLAKLQDISQFTDEVMLSIVEQVKAAAGGLFVYDSASSTMRTRALVLGGKLVDFSTDDPNIELYKQPVPMRDLALAWKAILTDPKGYFVQQVTLDDPGLAPGHAEWHLSQGHHSLAHFPLLCGEEPIGFFGLAFTTGIEMTLEMVELIAALGQQATLALELTRLSEADKRETIAREQEKAAQQRADALERVNATLRESVGKLSQQNDVGVFLAETLGEIVRQMNAANGLILIVDEEARMARLHLFHNGKTVRWGMSGAELPLFASPFSLDVTPAFDIMCQEHQPFCASRTPLPIPVEQFALPGAMEYMMRIGASDSAIITLRAGGRVIGTLHLQFVDGTVLREEDEPLFVAMSQQAAIAMRLTELAAESQQAAVIEERNRLAQEIHDTLAHSFNSIKFLLEATESGGILPARLQEIVAQARELASEGAREARRSVWALRPAGLERGDLLSALSAVIQQRTLETTFHIELCVEGEPFALHPEVEDNLLRVVQEALANVTNHARANRVEITLFYSAPELALCIRDDGIGFVPGQTKWGTGFGLGGMRERLTRLSGHLNIVSALGIGTEIRATVPDAQQREPSAFPG